MNRSLMVQQQSITHESAGNIIMGLFSVMYVIGGAGLEILNIFTTFLVFDVLFGWIGPMYGEIWRYIFVFSAVGFFAFSDVGGLARLTTPVQGNSEPKYVWVLFGIWMVIGIINALMTFMFLSDTIYFSRVNMSPASIQLLQYAPTALTIVFYAVRVMNMMMLGSILDRWIHGQASNTIPVVDKFNQWLNNNPGQNQNPRRGPNIGASQPVAALSNNSIGGGRAAGAASRYQQQSQPGGSLNRPKSSVSPNPSYHSISMSARPQVNQVPIDQNIP